MTTPKPTPVGWPVTSPCPVCNTVETRITYDIGSGPELSCACCEWCWGADGQNLQPLPAIDFIELREQIRATRHDPQSDTPHYPAR